MKLRSALAGTLCTILAAAGSASAATLTVCPRDCQFRELGPAVRAASPGDTVKVGAGTYRGGFSIEKNLSLVGAGASRTVIEGGGPVITIGTWLGKREPTVSLAGVTVSGGHTTSSPLGRYYASGGGIVMPPAADFRTGATVTIAASAITDNTVSPASQEPFGPPCPGDKPCPYAAANGGGIASYGRLSLVESTVAGNRAVGLRASDTDGGGIFAGFGSLTVRHSLIERNLAGASPPNGRFAEGGGIYTEGGETVEISDSEITANTASLESAFPFCLCGGQPFEVGVNSGGIHAGGSSKGSLNISRSHVDHNAVIGTAVNGQPEVFDSGLCACGNDISMSMIDSTVSHNRMTARVGSLENIFSSLGFATGGVLEFDFRASVSDVHVNDNSTTVTSASGAAIGSGAVFSGSPSAVLANSTISGNTVRATSGSGPAKIFGVGVTNSASLSLHADLIRDNVGTAIGRTGTAQGAGIWNGPFAGGPAVKLSVEGSRVTHNALRGSAGITLQGGGLFTAFPIILRRSAITENVPDACFGTTC